MVAAELESARTATAQARDAFEAERRAWSERDAFRDGLLRELRVPLRGVLGVADSLVSGDLALPSRAQLGLHAIVASGKRLDRMVSDVVDCASLGDLQIDLAPIDLHAAVSEVMVVMAPLAGEKSVELVNDVSVNFPIARGDETRVAQVLAHLLGNALESTERGEVRIAAERVNGMLRVSITDTGPGMRPDEVSRIFDETHGRRGLAFSKKLMELQRGETSFVSEPGHGSTASFTLPEAGPGAQRRGQVNVRTLSSKSFKSSIPVVNRALSRVLNLATASNIRAQERVADDPTAALESARFSLRQKAPLGLLAELDFAPASEPREASPPSSKTLSARPSLWPATAMPTVLHVTEQASWTESLARELEPLACRFVHADSDRSAADRLAMDEPYAAVVVDLRQRSADISGIVRSFRQQENGRSAPLVVVLDGAAERTTESLFAAGASDVLVRPFANAELLERLRSQIAVARLVRAAQRVVPREFVSLLGCSTFDELTLGACVEREMSVVFADLEGFTKASERMTSRQVFAWLNDRFGAVVPALRANGGFVDKFIGDAVMALFPGGAPGALRAAIEASHAMRAIDPVNRLGIGIHHGPTMIGTLGERERFAPTVVSDTVNVAARLEALTRRFGSSALVSEETLNQVDADERPATRYLGAVRVKGREKALRIHELLDADSSELASQKRASAAILKKVVEFVDRGDLENASRAAALGAAEYAQDQTLAFYIIELERIARREAPFDGVIALREK